MPCHRQGQEIRGVCQVEVWPLLVVADGCVAQFATLPWWHLAKHLCGCDFVMRVMKSDDDSKCVSMAMGVHMH